MSKLLKFASVPKPAIRANNVDAWVPEYWANESVAILEENMVMGNLVYRDFEQTLAEAGEVVNTRKPGEFKMKRKDIGDQVTVQDITATNIPVTLNQHLHTTFIVKDKEQSKSFKDLVAEYLHPALLSIAQGIDLILCTQAPRFLRTDGRTGGSLGVDASVASIVQTRKNLNDNKAPFGGRSFLVSTKDEAALLTLAEFTNAQVIGDDGTALREAMLGRKYGFDFYMAQHIPYVSDNSDIDATMLVNNAAGYPAGTTTLVVDGGATAVVGQWCTITGDTIPHQITAATGGPPHTGITIAPALKHAVIDNAPVTRYLDGKINLVAGYASGWQKELVYDNFTYEPQVGQIVTFKDASGSQFAIIQVDTVNKKILLDRPIDLALADNDLIFLGPLGAYNFAFTRNAIALVTRPMALPRPGTGAVGAVANYKNLSVRVVWAYDAYNQGTLVTVDVLAGVAILDLHLGEVMLG